jgi:tetratricopeptide (TPR) repeat protein
MNSPTGPSAVVVATSIPPKLARWNAGVAIGEEYQRLCIRSWFECGFRVISVNESDEIDELKPRYPEVDFVATHRNASTWTGRKNPYIADLLLALNDAPEPVLGIVNSDMVFEPSQAWRSALPSLTQGAIVIGQRYDATSLLNGTFRRYYPGYDSFFFDKALASAIVPDAMPFALGLPWWDYWLPCAAAFRRRQVLVVDRPSVVHLIHKQGYLDTTWREFALIFSQFVVNECERTPQAIPNIVAPFMSMCREVVASAETIRTVPADDEMIQKISEISSRLSWHIRQRPLRLERARSGSPNDRFSTASGKGLTPANVFSRFEEKFSAGEALERGKALQREGKKDQSAREFLAALSVAPEDSDLLLTYGEYVFTRGEKNKARMLLRQAVEKNPDSPHAHDSLGVVLQDAGKLDEAVACFKKALELDPNYIVVYLRLALALRDANRGGEALVWLDRALSKWPEFGQAVELRDRISSMVPSG